MLKELVGDVCRDARLHNHTPRDYLPKIGIEIELEGAHGEMDFSGILDDGYWSTTDDASLRNGGLEILTRGPVYPDADLTASVANLWEEWHALGLQGNARTGIHVHVNCQPYTFEQVYAIATLYALVEPWLFKFVGSDREENIYCVPWYRSTSQLSLLADISKAESTRAWLGRIRERGCKYSALYLTPLSTFGTVEFRHAPTFESVKDMERWYLTCAYIVARGADIGTTERVLHQWETTNHKAFLEYVLPFIPRDDVEETIREYDPEGVARTILGRQTTRGIFVSTYAEPMHHDRQPALRYERTGRTIIQNMDRVPEWMEMAITADTRAAIAATMNEGDEYGGEIVDIDEDYDEEDEEYEDVLRA